MDPLTPQDATRYWLSRRTCNDLFLLYCFTDTGRSIADLRAGVAARSATIPDLSVRVRERRFGYPVWVSREFTQDQLVDHRLPASTWSNVVAALGNLLREGVAADESAWRLHLFRGVEGAPGGSDMAVVAVLQLSHALADGQRAAAIARALFTESSGAGSGRAPGGGGPDTREANTGGSTTGESSMPHSVKKIAEESLSLIGFPILMARTVVRGFSAERARRAVADEVERGRIPPPAPSFPTTSLNRPPEPTDRAVRMLVRDDLRVPGYTVTVVALAAIASALARSLRAPDAELAAQVSMALPAEDPNSNRNHGSRNNYRDVGVELHGTQPDLRRRAGQIAADLEARRTRVTHPLLAAQGRVTAVLPAPVLRRDVATYPMDQVPEALGGHTVVSSVYRGPADLTLGGGRVRFTAGFPALGAVMHLTHGVHGLGDTVTVSIHADPAVLDVDAYAENVDAALTEVVAALRDSPADADRR